MSVSEKSMEFGPVMESEFKFKAWPPLLVMEIVMALLI